MARDGLFFKKIGKLNEHHVPAVALIAQGIWASFLTLPRTVTTDAQGKTVYGNVYTQLLEYIISADLVFYALMVGAVIVLRKKLPDVERPYRTFGYPFVPLVYIVLATFVILDLAYLAPFTSGMGYVLVLAGIPVYFFWQRQTRYNAEGRHEVRANK
jgi:APA family basic amino acid/polyamine antiporter